jgi:predicted RNase H-like HicB family nuclease
MPHYTYRVYWSDADQAYIGVCHEFDLSWTAPRATAMAALDGIKQHVAGVVAEMTANGEPLPTPLIRKND